MLFRESRRAASQRKEIWAVRWQTQNDSKRNTDGDVPPKPALAGIAIEIPGLKIAITGLPALGVFLAVVTLIVVCSIYLVTSKPENLHTVISSLNPKAESSSQKLGREMFQFWVPDTPEYRKNAAKFETWLQDNNGWWGKLPMENVRLVDGTKRTMAGFLYQVQEPVEGSELIGNPERAISSQAVKLLGVSDLNLIWTEVTSYEVK